MRTKPRRFAFFYDEVRKARYVYDRKYDVSHNMRQFDGWSFCQMAFYFGFMRGAFSPYVVEDLVALGWCQPGEKGYNHTKTQVHRPERPPTIDGAEFERLLPPRRKINEMG